MRYHTPSEAVRAVRRNKEAQVRGVRETVESHLWSTDFRPTYRGIRMLCSPTPPPRCSTVKAADGTTFTVESAIGARWDAYFKELYLVEPDLEFPVGADAVQDAEPSACHQTNDTRGY